MSLLVHLTPDPVRAPLPPPLSQHTPAPLSIIGPPDDSSPLSTSGDYPRGSLSPEQTPSVPPLNAPRLTTAGADGTLDAPTDAHHPILDADDGDGAGVDNGDDNGAADGDGDGDDDGYNDDADEDDDDGDDDSSEGPRSPLLDPWLFRDHDSDVSSVVSGSNSSAVTTWEAPSPPRTTPLVFDITLWASPPPALATATEAGRVRAESAHNSDQDASSGSDIQPGSPVHTPHRMPDTHAHAIPATPASPVHPPRPPIIPILGTQPPVASHLTSPALDPLLRLSGLA